MAVNHDPPSNMPNFPSNIHILLIVGDAVEGRETEGLEMITILFLLAITTADQDNLINAIRHQESSNGTNKRDGDDGASIGNFQIQLKYFQDSIEHNRELRKYTYQDCRKDKVAVLIIKGYWKRYGTKSWLKREPTLRDLARLHNGGLHSRKFQTKKKEAKLKKYWREVQAHLKKAELKK